MSAPKTRANYVATSAPRLPSASSADGSIPTCHEPLSGATLDVFSDWLAVELARLEVRFRTFTTSSSLKISLKR